jgi:nucleotidyltransferase-like protein
MIFLSISEEATLLPPDHYPGTPAHQALLGAVVDHYAGDARVLAVCLFGSLARGDGDEYSDLDLDIVLADGLQIAVADELARLCASFARLGEHAGTIVVRHADRGDVVLASLRELSIRYHPLATTSPNIVESLLLLSGRIPAEAIRAAGEANRRANDDSPETLLAACVRYAVEVDVALRRGRPWIALDLLGRMRDALMELYARVQGGGRPLQTFEARADAALQERLGATVAAFDPDSIHQALSSMLALLDDDLDAFTGGHVRLTDGQRLVLRALHQRNEAPA